MNISNSRNISTFNNTKNNVFYGFNTFKVKSKNLPSIFTLKHILIDHKYDGQTQQRPLVPQPPLKFIGYHDYQPKFYDTI